jgi:SpoVK/Ycf46/Vps4 family AAA+-type ATPase
MIWASMNAELLRRIVKSYRARNDDGFLKAVQALIESERKQGHVHLAKDLAALLKNGEPHQLARSVGGLSQPPRSKGEALSLIDVKRPTKTLRDIVLADETRREVERILEEFGKRNELAGFGLAPKKKLLLFGPPGNGKTLCAEVLAGELDLPLFYVRFDGLIGSYLGETAANLRRVFEYAAHGLGVLFFDEFDALGKSRDSREDVGELKRVVNSYLQLLDNYQGPGPVIAATNYERLLDHALWRRFDALVFFPQATPSQLVKYLSIRLGAFELRDFGPKEAADWCNGSSYSDAARTCTEALKTMILAGKSYMTAAMFKDAAEGYQTANRYRAARTTGSAAG